MTICHAVSRIAACGLVFGLNVLICSAHSQVRIAKNVYLIRGSFPADRGPDGNTYVLVGDHELTVIDTGRHQAHLHKIEEFARHKKLPILAIINTHWHLDHTSGNVGLRQDFPLLKVYASSAVNDALAGPLARRAEQTRVELARGSLDPVTAEERRHGLDTLDHSQALRPDVIIDHTQQMLIGGHPLEIHLSRNAATAGDVWVVDPKTHIAFVGDLVTFPAVLFDSACPLGWEQALRQIDDSKFKLVAPGHGPLLSRAEFGAYRSSFQELMLCASSTRSPESCAEVWTKSISGIGRLSRREKRMAQDLTVGYITEMLRPSIATGSACTAR